MTRPPRRRRRAFTLVELLVVIGVIAVQKVEENGMYAGYIKINFGTDPATWRDASPLNFTANAKASPKFLFASASDGNPNSKKMSDVMVDRIQAAGGHAQSAFLDNKTHFMANYAAGQEGDPTGEVILRFIREPATAAAPPR
jgi:prepilin-type N-terminal cleavage/methylation domain-containing protein